MSTSPSRIRHRIAQPPTHKKQDRHLPVAFLAALAIVLVAGCGFERPPAPSSAPAIRIVGQPTANPTAAVANYDPAVDYFPDKATFDHAEQVRVSYHRTYKVVDITYRGLGERLRLILHQRGTPAPPHDPDARIIEVPLERYTLGSYRYAGVADRLGVLDPLIALANWRNSTTPAIQVRLDDGRLPRNLSQEIAAGHDSEVHFEYYTAIAFNAYYDSYASLGVQVVPLAEHLEQSPLAKAEWIKLFGAFFNREADATAIFDAAAERYTSLATRMRELPADDRPRVFVQTAVRDEWSVFGARNAFARLVADAGGEYVWPDVDNALAVTYQAMELALVRGIDADIWIIGPDYAAGTSPESSFFSRQPFPFIRPVRRGAVYAADRSAGRANPYWDQALYQPDVELADYVRMLHPDRLPGHELRFYRRLDVPADLRGE